MTTVGFTGSREGMTWDQIYSLELLLGRERPERLHHGCCVGADAEAHRIALAYGVTPHRHPPTDQRLMDASLVEGDAEEPQPYLRRNHAIVDACDVLAAAPDGPERLKSGTWATVRYARKRGKRIVMLPLALLVLAAPAHADVTLTLVPDASTATVLSPDGWLLTATGDGDLAPTLILPGHGAGELAGDEPGDPVYGKNDADTKWVVTDAAGAMQTGRVLSWPVMSAPFSLHISVLTPALAAWFHAGAGASWSSTPVVGVAKGGQIEVEQSGVVNSGWFDASAYPRVFMEWDVSNTTNDAISIGTPIEGVTPCCTPAATTTRSKTHASPVSPPTSPFCSSAVRTFSPLTSRGTGQIAPPRSAWITRSSKASCATPKRSTRGSASTATRCPTSQKARCATSATDAGVKLVAERLGLPAGFTLVSSTLGDPEYRNSPHSFSAEWSDAVTIPPHSSIEWDVWLDAPWGSGVVHARLQITEADGTRDGTGNKGPALQLQERP